MVPRCPPRHTLQRSQRPPLRWGRFFGHRASDMRNRAMAGVVAPGQTTSFNDSPQSWVCWTNHPFPRPCQPCPGMKPKWTKDDTRLMARVLPFFVGMFSLASFFKGDGLLAGARAGVALWLITIGALGYVAFRMLARTRATRRRRSEGPRASILVAKARPKGFRPRLTQ